MINLVELYTVNGGVYIDTKELDSGITNLTAYTCQGLADSKVHRDKLFASSDLADQNYNRVLVDTTSHSRRHTDKCCDVQGKHYADIYSVDTCRQLYRHESIYMN